MTPPRSDDVHSAPARANRVLVTGFPRSGTTFVGRVLATPKQVAYLHEPLNPNCGLPAARRSFVDLRNEEFTLLAQQMDDLFELRGRLRGAVYPTDSVAIRGVKLAIRGRGPAHLLAARALPRPDHVLIKDPFAMPSISWFESRGCSTILLVRHPAAIVASFRRLGWSTDDHLLRFAEEGLFDQVEQAWYPKLRNDLDRIALFWRVLYRRAVDDVGTRPLFLHEQLSREPIATIEQMREATGLPASPGGDRKLRSLTSGRVAAAEPSGRTQQFRRASAEILDATLAMLSESERARIWEVAGDVAERWYVPDGVR